MRPVSQRFLRAVRGSHQAVTQAYIVAAGQTGVSPTGTQIPIFGGDVQLDAKAAVRSTLELDTDGQLWPTGASDPLAPYGNEVFVRRGIAFGGGAVEWVSLGYHRIYTPEQDDAPDGAIRVQAQDRMSGIVEARLLAPVQFGPAALFGDVVEQLVLEVYPWATIEWDDATDAQPIARSVIAEEDRYAFLNELVTSVGKTWAWDHRGILVIASPPDPHDPVFDVDAGAGGVLVSVSRSITRVGVYNAVVATGEAADTDAPPRAVAVDANPSSPTYWDGPFGKVPRFYSSPFITTELQAKSAAESILRTTLGVPYSVDLSFVPNPALEPFDPILVRYPGRVETHILDQLTVPLVATDAMSGQTREQTLVVIGSV